MGCGSSLPKRTASDAPGPPAKIEDSEPFRSGSEPAGAGVGADVGLEAAVEVDADAEAEAEAEVKAEAEAVAEVKAVAEAVAEAEVEAETKPMVEAESDHSRTSGPAETPFVEVALQSSATQPAPPSRSPPIAVDERPLPALSGAPADSICDAACGCGEDEPVDADGWLEGLEDDVRVVEVDWRQRLTAEMFRVLRMKGTEEIHSGEYNDHFEPGAYACSGCGQLLYSSQHKFRTGHGWPAFFDSYAGALERHGKGKVEVTCSGCGGHIGHVFRHVCAIAFLLYHHRPSPCPPWRLCPAGAHGIPSQPMSATAQTQSPSDLCPPRSTLERVPTPWGTLISQQRVERHVGRA